ncbi:MAG: hypothetical protein ACI9ZM_003889, partial [Paracoccaceae bacterium]
PRSGLIQRADARSGRGGGGGGGGGGNPPKKHPEVVQPNRATSFRDMKNHNKLGP